MPLPHKPEPENRSGSTPGRTSPAETREIEPTDLPLYCPRDDMALWNHHPRVYLTLEDDEAVLCPYCGTRYVLKAPTP